MNVNTQGCVLNHVIKEGVTRFFNFTCLLFINVKVSAVFNEVMLVRMLTEFMNDNPEQIQKHPPIHQCFSQI